MDFDRRTREIIETAERALAALAAEAAAARDYSRATALLATAQRVAGAVRNSDVRSAPEIEPADADVPSSRNGDSSPKLVAALPTTRGTKKSNSYYPRFKREDDTLVKIGWSKSDKATYEHRSPRDVLDQLVVRIAEVGARGERFITEQLMPLEDSSGAELPSYQVYLCLAWLVSQGLIERHGRQGYTVTDTGALPPAVEHAWSSLPKR